MNHKFYNMLNIASKAKKALIGYIKMKGNQKAKSIRKTHSN